MHIEILGTESLAARGLCCLVQVGDRKIVIDPGLALGYERQGLLPHPVQVAVGEQVRRRIIDALKGATDVVMSHFHGDHVPLPSAPLRRTTRLWIKGPEGLSPHMVRRRASLAQALGREPPNAEGQSDGTLTFSPSVPHGKPHTHLGMVMMTRIERGGTVFVHASDIQLLGDRAMSLILDWCPDIALVGGPPLYLSKLPFEQRAVAWENTKRLARHVETLILDHHLLRCEEGLHWLDRLSSEAGHQVMCAADFMGRPRCLFEARRAQLYEEMPVPDGWHEAYARGDADTLDYRDHVRECPQDSSREGESAALRVPT
jgi:predicted metallo-beta-lactamase superfamily hydrolase